MMYALKMKAELVRSVKRIKEDIEYYSKADMVIDTLLADMNISEPKPCGF